MLELTHSDGQTFGGISILQAWKPGKLAGLLWQGMTLPEAKAYALRQGWLVDENTVHNLVMTGGKNWEAQMIGGLQTVGITYCAIGTGSTAPLVSDTQLAAEAARMAITLATVAVNVLTIDAWFAAASCNYAIGEAGWFAGPTATGTSNSGVLVAHYLQPYNNSGGSPNDLTLEWIDTFN